MLTLAAATAAVAGAAGAGWYLGPMLGRRRAEAALRERCRATRTLVLTYDDGPGPGLTPRLLALLAARGVRATFFLAGFRAARHPDVVDRAAAAGHELGCHADRHLNAWRTGPRRAALDIADGYRALDRWLAPDAIFRPPYGKLTAGTRYALHRRGAPLGWWTIDTGDAGPAPEPVARTVARVRGAGGGVVLMHDYDRGHGRPDHVLTCTERLLDLAATEGWSVRTLGALHAAPATPAIDEEGERRHAA